MRERSDQDYVLRLAVVGSGGRRSSTWRIWTGSRYPSDDIYIAPRGSKGFKVTLHSDGYCQHGPTELLRKASRPEDRQAFDRWTEGPEVAPGVRVAYGLLFLESQLRSYSNALSAEVLEIPSAPNGYLRAILVCLVDEAVGWTGLGLQGHIEVGKVTRKTRGPVIVLTAEVPGGHELLADARALTIDPQQSWATPQAVNEDDRVAYYFPGASSYFVPRVLELTVDTPPSVRQGFLDAEFKGTVHSWLDRPIISAEEPNRFNCCAVLIVPRWPGRPKLFIDDRSRCDHLHLADDANELFLAAREGRTDDGWNRLADGSYMTWILPRAAGRRLGRYYDMPPRL